MPKTLAFLFLLCLGFISFTQAQTPAISQNTVSIPWKFNVIDYNLGVDVDNYGTLSYSDILSLARNPQAMERDLQGLEEEMKADAAGVGFYTHFGFSRPNIRKGTFLENHEMRVGFGFHCPKEAMLSYKNSAMDTTIVFCHIRSELSIEGAYLLKGVFWKRMNWMMGVGANLGASLNNQLMVVSGEYLEPGVHPSNLKRSQVEEYSARPVGYARMFLQYGLGYGFGKRQTLVFGPNLRIGTGRQMVSGGNANLLRNTFSMLLSLRLQLP